jgi:hypothetical protein
MTIMIMMITTLLSFKLYSGQEVSHQINNIYVKDAAYLLTCVNEV